MKVPGSKRRLSNEGKRSVHVKWDGKTIALGTFPDEDAAIMCKRAKTLTKTWRSIFPKPTVEEVKRSLETSGIRVVNDRPGRQARKKDGGPNRKGRPPITAPKIEETSVPQQSQASSLSSFLPIPAHPIVAATMEPGIDSVTDITGGGGKPSNSKVQAGLLIIAPTTALKLDRQIPLIGLQKDNEDPSVVIPVTNLIETDSQMQDQVEGQFSDPDLGQISDPDIGRLVDPDLGDLNIERTHDMLEKHYSNLTSEIKEIKMLMNFYRDKRNQQQLMREQHQRKQKDENEIDVQINPDMYEPVSDPPIQSYQYCEDHKIEETSQPREILELCVPADDGEDNDSMTDSMGLEEWTF